MRQNEVFKYYRKDVENLKDVFFSIEEIMLIRDVDDRIAPTGVAPSEHFLQDIRHEHRDAMAKEFRGVTDRCK